MPKHLRTGLAALVAATLLAVPAAAQEKLAVGTWTGVVIPPDEAPLDIDYEVWYDEEGALAIELTPPPDMGGPIAASEVSLTVDALSFTLEVGDTVRCQLLLIDDGHYEGECIDSSGEAGIMSMFPPGPDGR